MLYSLVIDIETSVHENWLEWVQNYYITEMLQTGCFEHCRISRLIEDEDAGFKTYRLDYICPGIEAYKHYQTECAQDIERKMKRKFMGKFSSMSTLYDLVSEEKSK